MNRVENKNIIITGGASGIGKEAAFLLAKEGANIAILDQDEINGLSVANEVCKESRFSEFWKLDVTDEDSIKNTLMIIHNKWKRIDGLVNCAGVLGENKPTHEITIDEWNLVNDVNVKGVFLLTKHIIPFLIKAGGGSIINISSIYSNIGSGGYSPYHASKAAVKIMTKTDAICYAKNNIRVNSIHPGFIWTPMLEDVSKHYPGGLNAYEDYAKKLHPLGRLGHPKDVAYGILYLASDESSFVTGSELIIDGGYTAQ